MLTKKKKARKFTNNTSNWLLDTTLAPVFQDFFRFYSDFQNGSLNKGAVALWLLKIIGIITVLTLPFAFLPGASIILFGLPLISNLLTALACPVNKIIRPLAALLHLSPYIVGPALAVLLGVSAFLFFNFFPVTALASLVLPAVIILTLYSLYVFGKIIKKIYDISPQLAFLQLAITIVSMVIAVVVSLLIPGAYAATPLVNFLISLFGAVIIHKTHESLESIKQEEAKLVEALPLPQEVIPEELKQTVLQEVKTGHYSSRFFNTRKEAEFIGKKDRTLWQQTACFFGGGEIIQPTVSEEQTHSHSLPCLLLEQ